MTIAILYRQELRELDFGPGHPYRGNRYDVFYQFLKGNLPEDDNYRLIKASSATNDDLHLICSQEYIDFTKSALLKGNALNFETLYNLLDMLNTMALYGLPADYIKQEEAFIKSLTVEKQLEVANKYIDPARMYYVVVGDAKTQLKELEKVGLGKPVLYVK